MRNLSKFGSFSMTTALYGVPDKSIVNMAIDLSDLEGTNIHLGLGEIVAPDPSSREATVTSLVEWLRKGCHATMIPLDGADRTQMRWLRGVLAGVVGGLNEINSARVGLIWRRVDGLDVDLLEEYKREVMEPSWPAGRKDSWMSQASQSGRPDSGRMKPRTVVSVRDEGELDAVLSVCLLGETIKQDCVVSIVFHDEEGCLFSMLHVAVAGTSQSFLDLASLVEEIGQLHGAGRAGDFRLKSAEMTDLNALASNYARGDSKLFVVAYGEDLSYVDSIVSVCACSQTVWTDLLWLDAGIVRRAASVMSWEALGAGEEEGLEADEDVDGGGDDDDEVTYEIDTTEEPTAASLGRSSVFRSHDSGDISDDGPGSLASCFQSPSIASIRQSLREHVAREMSTAAKRAASKIDADSPTTEGDAMMSGGMMSGMSGKSYTERRLLFPSLRQSHASGRVMPPARRPDQPNQPDQSDQLDQQSRDFFSSLRTIQRFADVSDDNPNVDSISLQRPTTTGEALELDGLSYSRDSRDSDVEVSNMPTTKTRSPSGATANTATVTAPTTETTTTVNNAAAYGAVFKNIETRIHERFEGRLRDLTERLEISEMRRIELQASYDVLINDGPSAGWDFSDHQSLIKSLQEEVKRCKSLEAAMSSMEQTRLEVDVEVDAKDREIGLLRARVRALESESDVSEAYKLSEESLASAQEECRVLRQENADLVGRLAAMEVSNLMAANGVSAILPEDEDYDVDSEARIIYKLHERLKLATRRSKRLEAENSDLRSKLQEGQRNERVAIVTKRVCDKLKQKVNALQRELNSKKTNNNKGSFDGVGRRVDTIDVRCFA